MSTRPDITDAVTVFSRILTKAGQGAEDLASDAALRLFGRFAAERFDTVPLPDADGLLYEYGTFAFTGQDMFHLGLTRQFALADVVGDHEGLVQFHCTLLYPPDPELRALGTHNQWWFYDDDDGPLLEWLENIAARPEWTLLRSRRPAAVEIGSERV